MDQIVEAGVPSVGQEAARDLVRARDDVRGDLMRCRHRRPKLLLRHGIVYSGGKTWIGLHETWLRGQHFTHCGSRPDPGHAVAPRWTTTHSRCQVAQGLFSISAKPAYDDEMWILYQGLTSPVTVPL